MERKHKALLTATAAFVAVLSFLLMIHLKDTGPSATSDRDTGFLDVMRFTTNRDRLDFPLLFRLASESHATGNYAEALTRLDWMADQKGIPPDLAPEIAYLLADSCRELLRNGRDVTLERCLAAYIKAWDLAGDSPRTPLILFRMGEAYLLADDPMHAEESFDRLAKAYPNHPLNAQTAHLWGNYHFEHNDYSRAAGELWKHFQARPSSPETEADIPRLALALNLLADHGRALELMDFVAAKWPVMLHSLPELMRIEGEAAHALGDETRAFAALLGYVNATPFAPQAAKSMDTLRLLDPEAAPALLAYARALDEFRPSPDGATLSPAPFLIKEAGGFHIVGASFGHAPDAPLPDRVQLRLAIHYYLAHQATLRNALRLSDPALCQGVLDAANALADDDPFLSCFLDDPS